MVDKRTGVGAGGTSVLAHPNQIDLDHHLRPLVRLGLQGLEVYRPRVMERRQGKLLALAEKHDLVVTGGSDFHGVPPGEEDDGLVRPGCMDWPVAEWERFHAAYEGAIQ